MKQKEDRVKKEQERRVLELKVSSQRNHRPGLHHQLSDGTVYHVMPSGAWKRMTPRACDQHKGFHNHGVQRRRGGRV